MLAAGACTLAEFGTELQLTQSGPVSMKHYRDVGRDVLQERAQKPNVVTVNHVGTYPGDDAPQVIGPRVFVRFYLGRRQRRKSRARIGHDVAHPWDGEWNVRTARLGLGREAQRVNTVLRESTDLGGRVVSRRSHDHMLIPPGRLGVTNQRIERNPARGERRAL